MLFTLALSLFSLAGHAKPLTYMNLTCESSPQDACKTKLFGTFLIGTADQNGVHPITSPDGLTFTRACAQETFVRAPFAADPAPLFGQLRIISNGAGIAPFFQFVAWDANHRDQPNAKPNEQIYVTTAPPGTPFGGRKDGLPRVSEGSRYASFFQTSALAGVSPAFSANLSCEVRAY